MFDFLATTNIQAVIDELVDIRQYATDFRWLNRIGLVPALDGEVMARYKGRIYAADIITLDGKAVIRSAPAVRLTQTEIPVYKHGVGFTREMLRLIRRIEQNLASRGEMGMFANLTAEEVKNLIMGVYTRMEAVGVGMLVDGYSYNKLGVTMDNVSWGMPSDLKITLTGTAKWSAPSTAKPFDNITAVRQLGRVKYGIDLDRLTLSTTAFNYMTNTADFISRAQGMFLANQAILLPQANIQEMMPLAQKVLGIPEIEIDDRQFFTELADAAEGINRYQPENMGILTARQFDGTRRAYDFANAECEEAMPGMVPDIIGGFEGMEGAGYGPLGYATAASPDGNPPGLNLWGVASGFPRKHKEAASAVITLY